MIWQTFWATFALVFLAELGDKTQLTILTRSAAHNPWTVLAASIAALALASLLAILLGGVLQKYIPGRIIQIAGGLLFLAFGAAMLLAAFRASS